MKSQERIDLYGGPVLSHITGALNRTVARTAMPGMPMRITR